MELNIISQAAMYNGAGQKITYEDIKLTVGENDILIRVKASMFGKALHRALVYGHPKIRPNTVLGTLFTGEVINDNKFFPKKTRVVVNPHKPCGKCINCMNGKENLCTNTIKINPGGISEYVLIDERNADSIVALDDGIPYEEAVLTEIAACVLESAHKTEIREADYVLIAGSGLTAFIHAQILKSMGVKNIDILYKDESRKAIIERIGATALNYEWSKEEVFSLKREGNKNFDGYNIIFEVVGNENVLEKSLDLVTSKGKVILFGGYPIGSRINVDLNFLHYKEISLIGTYHFKNEYFEKALIMMKEKQIDLSKLITNQIYFEELEKAVEEFNKKECITLIVKY